MPPVFASNSRVDSKIRDLIQPYSFLKSLLINGLNFEQRNFSLRCLFFAEFRKSLVRRQSVSQVSIDALNAARKSGLATYLMKRFIVRLEPCLNR